MAAQSLLAKLGLRLSVEGSSADLAFAFPLTSGDPSMAAHTDASRIGMFSSRTVGDELVGTVVMGVEVMAVGSRGLTSNRSGASQSEAFGLRAGNLTMSGARNTLVGYTSGQAIASGARNTAVGAASLGAATVANDCVAAGYRALANVTGSGSTALGTRAGEFLVSGTHNVFLGIDAGDATDNSASNRLVAGSSTGAIQDVFFGNGEVHAVPVAYTLHGVGGSGTDIAGAGVNIAGGQGTGTGAGGSVVIRTAPVGASSAVANALVDRLTVAGDGGVTWTGIATASAPALSAANGGTIFYDSTLQTFRVSMNGAAYVNLMDGSGTVTSVGLALPSFITVSGSPVTTSGTLTGTLATQTANTVFAGPSTGVPAAPTFRALVAADLPAGVIGGTIAAGQVAYGSGADTITGDSKFTFSATTGLNVNMASGGADNLTLGTNAGDSLTSGARNTTAGVGAGTSLTTTNDNVAVGYNALTACTATGNTAIGSAAADGVTASVRIVAVGFNALGSVSSSNGVNDCTAVGYNALLLATGPRGTVIGSEAGDALTTAQDSTAVGYRALTTNSTGNQCTAVGSNALGLTTASNNTALGWYAGRNCTTGLNNIFIGVEADTTSGAVSGSIVLGSSAVTTADNQFVAGSGGLPISNVYFGTGVTNAAPTAYTINGTGGSGTDIAGASLQLAGGRGTGTGAGGTIVFQTAKAGTTGSSLNALTDRLEITQDGALAWVGITTANSPAVSAASRGTIFYDSTLQKFQYSENGGAYADCFGAGGGGTVTSVSVTTANGVSGSVATATTTPAITITLGDITPSKVTTSQVNLSGNLSAAAWTTNGIRLFGTPGTLTDTSSSGTVAAAYTNVLGGNTIAASSVTAFTNYVTAYFTDPVAGTNVTLTNKWALGADSLRIGTSNHVTITAGGILSATTAVLTNPTVTNYVESVVAIGTVTASHTFDLTNGTIQTVTLTASTACTFTMPTAVAGKSFTVLLKQAASTGNGTATFTSVKWPGATAPTITATAGRMDLLAFVSDGSNWYGTIAQNYTP